jgi:hypothetical protein
VHEVVGLHDGVWWDTPTTHVRPLWHILGRLSEVEGDSGEPGL